jgi:hypothetical protein
VHIVTALSRPYWALAVYRSIRERLDGLDWRWWVSHDVVIDLPDELWSDPRVFITSVVDPPKPAAMHPPSAALHYGNPLRNASLAAIEKSNISGVVTFLDDDTEVHPSWKAAFEEFVRDHYARGAVGFIVWQEYVDRTPRLVWEVESTGNDWVDTGMFAFRTETIQGLRWIVDPAAPAAVWYSADMTFLRGLWSQYAPRIWICRRMASVYNSLKQKTGRSFVPLGHPAWAATIDPLPADGK